MKKLIKIIIKILIMVLSVYLLSFIWIKSSPLLDYILHLDFVFNSPDWIGIPTVLIIIVLYVLIPLITFLILILIAYEYIEDKFR